MTLLLTKKGKKSYAELVAVEMNGVTLKLL